MVLMEEEIWQLWQVDCLIAEERDPLDYHEEHFLQTAVSCVFLLMYSRQDENQKQKRLELKKWKEPVDPLAGYLNLVAMKLGEGRKGIRVASHRRH